MSKSHAALLMLVAATVGFSAGASAQYPASHAVVKLPASGAAFMDPADPPQPSDVQKRLDKIENLLIELNKKIDKIMEDGGPEPEAPAAGTTANENVLGKGLTKCIGCHSQKDAPKNGDRFVMFQKPDGNNYPLRDDFRRSELKAIEDKVRDGTMPKKSAGVRLTAEETAAIIAEAKARRAELEKVGN